MTKKRIFASCLLFFLCASYMSLAYTTEKTAKIINGKPADVDAWPWISGLIYKDASSLFQGQFCGASLIAKNWVLTAAHCVYNENINDFDVIIGQTDLSKENTERFGVKRVIVHPLYDAISFDNDLALIQLTKSSNTPPIQVLPSFSSQDQAEKSAVALGWGAVSYPDLTFPSKLQQTNIPIIDSEVCAFYMDDITENMLCAGSLLGQTDTCTGDSGGPLLVFDTESKTWRQAGITSWGLGCAEVGTVGVYTRLKNFAAFISRHICSSVDTPQPVTLKLKVKGNNVTAEWNTQNNIMGYRINYAPYPDVQTIGSLDTRQNTSFSINLPSGSAFYVAITGYNNNCLSNFSNIEHFVIK